MNNMEYEIPSIGKKNAPQNLCGSRIYAERSKHFLTAGDLAARLQLGGSRLDADSILRIENGTRAVRDYELRAIARALGDNR